jgi:hypothetical protein
MCIRHRFPFKIRIVGGIISCQGEGEPTIEFIATMTAFEDMMAKMVGVTGFIAALDQSGGSTPKALKQYGIPDSVGSTTATSNVGSGMSCA